MVYVHLKYDDVFVLWLIVVCEWVGGCLFVMGSCVICAWCGCYVLCGCMNGASPARSVLSLLYMRAFQMNPVCVMHYIICEVFSVARPHSHVASPSNYPQFLSLFFAACESCKWSI